MITKTAATLRIKNLYHYQSFVKPERFVRIFTEGTIFFSIPRDFNDPWDCRPCFSKSRLDDPQVNESTIRFFVNCGKKWNKSLPEEEHSRRERKMHSDRKFLEWMIDQMTSNMQQAIQTQYRVYCLSPHPDSILMWSHYADKFKGLCLEFSVQNELFCGALQVQYFKEYPILSITDTDEDANLRFLLSKSDDWAYEQEFRVIATQHPFVIPDFPTANQGFVGFPLGALKAVIVGPLMPESDRMLINDIVRKSGWNIAVKVASLVQNRYQIEIPSID